MKVGNQSTEVTDTSTWSQEQREQYADYQCRKAAEKRDVVAINQAIKVGAVVLLVVQVRVRCEQNWVLHERTRKHVSNPNLRDLQTQIADGEAAGERVDGHVRLQRLAGL